MAARTGNASVSQDPMLIFLTFDVAKENETGPLLERGLSRPSAASVNGKVKAKRLCDGAEAQPQRTPPQLP